MLRSDDFDQMIRARAIKGEKKSEKNIDKSNGTGTDCSYPDRDTLVPDKS